jgi:hypothetical protein
MCVNTILIEFAYYLCKYLIKIHALIHICYKQALNQVKLMKFCAYMGKYVYK